MIQTDIATAMSMPPMPLILQVSWYLSEHRTFPMDQHRLAHVVRLPKHATRQIYQQRYRENTVL